MSKENRRSLLGICRRIFNFLKDEEIARGMNRVYLDNNHCQSSDDRHLLPLSHPGEMVDSDTHVPIVVIAAGGENTLGLYSGNSSQVGHGDKGNVENIPVTISIVADKKGKQEEKGEMETIREGKTPSKPGSINLIATNINERSEKFIRRKEEMMNMEFKEW